MKDYQKEANDLAKKLGIKLTEVSKQFKKHFADDTEQRWVFKMKLQRGKKSYTFEFGQSINSGEKTPTMYDVLSCFQKYDTGTFENFCGDFGYDSDSRNAEKIYKAVSKEYEAMTRLFNSEELDMLQEIS